MKIFLPVVDTMCFSVNDEEKCFTIGEFCEFIKKGRESEDFMLQVLKQYGKNSLEFLFCVQGLIWWVFNKYVWFQQANEDTFNDIYLEILEKMDKYDESKGRLLNYLHTIIRGKLTKELHRNNMQYRFFMDVEIDKGEKYKYIPLGECFVEWKNELWMEYEDGDKYDEKYLVLVLSLAELLDIDLRVMGYLFNKYGKDVLYFFYMLAGKTVKVWDCERLSGIIEQVLQRYDGKVIKSQHIQDIVDVVIEFVNKNCKNWRG